MSLTDEYLTWMADVRRRQPGTISTYRDTLRAWEARLGGRWPGMSDVEQFLQRKDHSPATFQRELSCLKGYYRWGIDRGFIAHEDPTIGIAPPKRHARQPKPVSDAVWLKAWDQPMTASLRCAMGLGYYCGLRRAEITSLEGSQVTDHRINAFVRKGGGEDTLPWLTLTRVYAEQLGGLGVERFVEALNVRRREPFLTPYREPAWMNRAMASQGVPFTPHQLRHSCATNLIRADVPLPIVSRMLNHTSIQTTMLYVKAGGDELHTWLNSQ